MNLEKQTVAKTPGYSGSAVASSQLEDAHHATTTTTTNTTNPSNPSNSSNSSLPNGVSSRGVSSANGPIHEKDDDDDGNNGNNGNISTNGINGNGNSAARRRANVAHLNIPVPTKFQLSFPPALERLLAPLDDFVVLYAQKRTSGLIHAFVMSLTFFSAIEFSLTAPATLYALGYDKAAGLSFSVLWVLCIVSQIPKKFIFRKRPWMSGRALPIRQDRTSSFPSRAVVCAVVFSWLIGQSLFAENILQYHLPSSKLWAGIISVAALTAFARINVGAHYASDTIVGFFLGLVVINIGSNIERYWQASGCVLEDAYATNSNLAAGTATVASINPFPYIRFFFSTLLAYALTLISIQGFWVKCSYVYGLLLSCATFRACFLCVSKKGGNININNNNNNMLTSSLLRVDNHGSIQTHARAILLFLTFLIFGMATRGNKGRFRYIVFTLIYFGTLTCIMYWRLP